MQSSSGRLLAGLRWWSVIEDENSGGNGKAVWRFESRSVSDREAAPQNASQIYLFWVGLLGQQMLWALLMLIALFRVRYCQTFHSPHFQYIFFSSTTQKTIFSIKKIPRKLLIFTSI
jgi:predicted small integral membrane protein